MASLPNNDQQYKAVMREVGLGSVKLDMKKSEFVAVLTASSLPFRIHEDGTYIVEPVSNDGVRLAKTLLVDFKQEEIDSIILAFDNGLSYVSVR
ncbi:MAG TPA: hypothetical protein VFV64_07170 [Permianibacter sp.]|nr:hypothetical protein [Permianibacter sp.]